jgi:hypothetical protein
MIWQRTAPQSQSPPSKRPAEESGQPITPPDGLRNGGPIAQRPGTLVLGGTFSLSLWFH